MRKVIPGENDFATIHPKIAAEWHPTKNDTLTPFDILPGCNIKVWWLCSSCRHEWFASPNTRSKGHGCPQCGRKKAGKFKSQNAASFGNSIAEKNPSLSKEWDYFRNPPDRTPKNVSPWSDHKYYWICPDCNESYLSSVTNRTSGQGCPVCAKTMRSRSRHKTEVSLKGSLSELMPDLAAEWDYEKNLQEHQYDPTHPLTPKDVTVGSSARVWWRCSKGHEWQAKIYSRKINGCPICGNKQILAGYNDLATTHPKLAAEWHPTKNESFAPSNTSYGSDKIVWWLGACGHEWEASISSRIHGNGCPTCARELKTSFPEQTIYYYFKQISTTINRYQFNSRTEIDVYLPDFKFGIEYDGHYHQTEVAKRRDLRKNRTLADNGITLIRVIATDDLSGLADSDTTLYCKPTHLQTNMNEVVRKLLNRFNYFTGQRFYLDIDVERDRSEIYALYIHTKKENNLSIKNQKLAAEWHPTKNGLLSPETVPFGSQKKVWWLGTCGHEWEAIVKSRSKGSGCPYCSGRTVLPGFNDLSTINPILTSEWHPTKNGDLLPTMVTSHSNKRIWWQCSKGHEWQATIADRNGDARHQTGCPSCNRKIK